jgi:ArsR family transcriptional regulator
MAFAETRERKSFPVERLFRALADRTRLRLLNLMSGQDICVCYLVEALGTSQPKISRHLAYLRRAGIVAARREGKWMHYRIVEPRDPAAARILAAAQRWLTDDPAMKRDRQRLTRACCAPAKFVRLSGAPLPTTVRNPGSKAARAVSA